MNPKSLLAVLLCYVLLSAQTTYAIQGGPGGGGGTLSLDVVGTYSGVLTGVQDKDADTGITSASNSIALFSMNVPATGLATGTSIVFSGGRVFNGTLNAVVDPVSGSVRGILNATYNFTIPRTQQTGTDANGNPIFSVVQINVTAAALGKVTASIAAVNALNVSGFNGTPTSSLVTARLTGSAELDTNFGFVSSVDLSPIVDRITRYTLDGFKQQATSSVVGTTTLQ